jgi:predicted Zn-dependent peptidase
MELSNKYFSKLVSNTSTVISNGFKTVQTAPKIKLHDKKKEQTHVILGFIADGKNYKYKYAQTLLATILGGGMSSRMFTEVRERRGLAYSIRTSMDRYTDIGYMGTYAGLDTKRAEEAVKVMLEEHYKMLNAKTQMTSQELTKAKEFLKGHLALALEDTSDVSGFWRPRIVFRQSFNS